MEKEKDLEYSEIMELATIPHNLIPSPPQSNITDTRFATYVNVADILQPKDLSETSRLSPSGTFKRYSSIEDTDSTVVYENVACAAPIQERLERMASTDQILTVSSVSLDGPVENGGCDKQGNITVRLSIERPSGCP